MCCHVNEEAKMEGKVAEIKSEGERKRGLIESLVGGVVEAHTFIDVQLQRDRRDECDRPRTSRSEYVITVERGGLLDLELKEKDDVNFSMLGGGGGGCVASVTAGNAQQSRSTRFAA